MAKPPHKSPHTPAAPPSGPLFLCLILRTSFFEDESNGTNSYERLRSSDFDELLISCHLFRKSTLTFPVKRCVAVQNRRPPSHPLGGAFQVSWPRFHAGTLPLPPFTVVTCGPLKLLSPLTVLNVPTGGLRGSWASPSAQMSKRRVGRPERPPFNSSLWAPRSLRTTSVVALNGLRVSLIAQHTNEMQFGPQKLASARHWFPNFLSTPECTKVQNSQAVTSRNVLPERHLHA